MSITALHVAVFQGRTDQLQALVDEKKSDLNARDKYGQTASHIAGYKGAAEPLKLLLAAGADPTVIDKKGNGLLHAGAGSGCLEAVKLLLAAGVRVDTANEEGDTPLAIAEKHCPEPNKAEVLFLLREAAKRQAADAAAAAKEMAVDEASAPAASGSSSSAASGAGLAAPGAGQPSAGTSSLLALLETKLREADAMADTVLKLQQTVDAMGRRIEALELEAVQRLAADGSGGKPET